MSSAPALGSRGTRVEQGRGCALESTLVSGCLPTHRKPGSMDEQIDSRINTVILLENINIYCIYSVMLQGDVRTSWEQNLMQWFETCVFVIIIVIIFYYIG